MTTLGAAIDALAPDNTSGLITPAIFRQLQKDAGFRHFDTLAEIQATTIPTVANGGPNWVSTRGYTTVGDGGGWEVAVRLGSQPTGYSSYVQSVDGSYWALRAVDSTVNLLQFGALPMTDYSVMPAIDSATDCYAAFVAADRFIAAVYGGNVKLIIPSTSGGFGATWFMGRTHSLNRSNYTIEGSSFPGVIIRTPPYESGFMVASGAGIVDAVYAFDNPTFVGLRLIRPAGGVGEYNMYVATNVGNADFGSDTVLVAGANNTSTVYTWGTSTWRFLKNVGPASPWNYNATPNSGNFYTFRNIAMWSFWDGASLPYVPFGSGGATNPNGGYGGSSDTAFSKWPNQNLDVSGTPQYQIGIGIRSRCILENIQVLKYNGFGVAVVANGDPELPNMTGNVNGYDMRHIVSYYNGKDGIHIWGSDANAGNTYYVDSAANGRLGIADFSFLGNNWYGSQSAADGTIFQGPKQYLSGATYNGYTWAPRLPILGIESAPAYINEEPPFGWIRTSDYGGLSLGVKGTITGSISGTTLTKTAGSPTLAVGDMISSDPSGPHVRPGTTITGGSGPYSLSGASQTVSSTTITVMDGTFYYSDQMQPWSPTIQYEVGGASGSNNSNARCFWAGSYQEGGTNPAQPGPRDLVVGGMTQLVDVSRGATVMDSTSNWSNFSVWDLNFYDGTKITSGTNVPSSAGSTNGDKHFRTGVSTGQVWGYQWDGGAWKNMGTLS